MDDYLFSEFQKVTPKAWKSKIQVDLKGADYNETLLWTSNESITVKPFYTKEDRATHSLELPKNSFNICQSIQVHNEKDANKFAVDSLERGANSLEFLVSVQFDYNKLLHGIDLSKITIYFKFNFLNSSFFKKLSIFLGDNNYYYNIDIIGNLTKTGNWYNDLKSDHKELENILKSSKNCLAINTSLYQNAGASITQQLAYTLAHANEYIQHYGEKIISKIHFNFSVGSNYFFEIAKIRAFRLLWQALLKEYNTPLVKAHIFTQPSLRNKTLYDYNVNMLRTTSECMSAILGGADTVSNTSYDHLFHKQNEFGERISRNQLLILQEESGLKNAQHIANGTYYIESLTQQLSQNALSIFKQIEKAGGFLKQLKKGSIQRKISEVANKEQKQFDQQDLVLLGTNKIQNPNDKMNNELEVNPFKYRKEKTLLEPIIEKRLAEKLEQERLQNE